MNDSKYLKNVRFEHKSKIYKEIKKYIYAESDKIGSINDIIKMPGEFFDELSRYASLNNVNLIDKMAFLTYNIVLQNGLVQLKIGKSFLEEYNRFYTKFISDSALKEQTKAVYFKNFERIKKISGKNSLFDILLNPENFYKDLKKFASENRGRLSGSLGNHFIDLVVSIAVSLFAHNVQLKLRQAELYNRWKSIQDIIKKPIDAKYNANKPTKRQNLGISFEDVTKVRDLLKDGDVMKLLLLLYTEIPPLRSDYANVKILKKQGKYEDNYIFGDTFHLLNYKTSKKYGPKQIKLTKKIMDQIEISLKKNPREYLFIDSQNKPFCESTNGNNNFNKYFNTKLKKLFKNNNISLTYFRHLYLSRPDLKLNEKTLAEREKLSLIMGHSLLQQSRYFWL